jgi:hypothetical protein
LESFGAELRQATPLTIGVNAGCSAIGRTSTATILYSGQAVLTSEDCPMRRLVREKVEEAAAHAARRAGGGRRDAAREADQGSET